MAMLFHISDAVYYGIENSFSGLAPYVVQVCTFSSLFWIKKNKYFMLILCLSVLFALIVHSR